MFGAMEGFYADAVASQELAFIWATNTNVIHSAFWACLQVFRDAELLARVRGEAEAHVTQRTTHHVRFESSKLLQEPWLQAVFAETLRLRIHGFVVRQCPRHDVQVGGWTVPRGKFFVASSTPGHMDPDVWCTGEARGHPADEFWPGRFLEPVGGSRPAAFTMRRAKGAWIPFGGGVHACPGRQ